MSSSTKTAEPASSAQVMDEFLSNLQARFADLSATCKKENDELKRERDELKRERDELRSRETATAEAVRRAEDVLRTQLRDKEEQYKHLEERKTRENAMLAEVVANVVTAKDNMSQQWDDLIKKMKAMLLNDNDNGGSNGGTVHVEEYAPATTTPNPAPLLLPAPFTPTPVAASPVTAASPTDGADEQEQDDVDTDAQMLHALEEVERESKQETATTPATPPPPSAASPATAFMESVASDAVVPAAATAAALGTDIAPAPAAAASFQNAVSKLENLPAILPLTSADDDGMPQDLIQTDPHTPILGPAGAPEPEEEILDNAGTNEGMDSDMDSDSDMDADSNAESDGTI
jgi:hypothetical protein